MPPNRDENITDIFIVPMRLFTHPQILTQECMYPYPSCPLVIWCATINTSNCCPSIPPSKRYPYSKLIRIMWKYCLPPFWSPDAFLLNSVGTFHSFHPLTRIKSKVLLEIPAGQQTLGLNSFTRSFSQLSVSIETSDLNESTNGAYRAHSNDTGG